MHKRSLISVFAAIVAVMLLGLFASGFIRLPSSPSPISAYFTYTDGDLTGMKGVSRDGSKLDAAQVYAWETRAFDAVGATKTNETNASKLYASLAAGQRDFAALSWKVSGGFNGSFSPVSRGVICRFIKDVCPALPQDGDAYSKKLADIILAKLDERNAADANATEFETKVGPQYWHGKKPYPNLKVGNWKTWLLDSPSQFRLPEPSAASGTPLMAEQVKIVRDTATGLTDKQRSAVAYWAGNPGTKTPPGQWMEISSDFTRGKKLPLESLLLERSTLAMAIADTIIADYDTKYTYWSPRPSNVEPKLVTLMPTPNNPGYPSTQAAISGASDEVLTHFFPEETTRWLKVADESTNSRLWASIHFAMDDEGGFALGQNVGKQAVKASLSR